MGFFDKHKGKVAGAAALAGLAGAAEQAGENVQAQRAADEAKTGDKAGDLKKRIEKLAGNEVSETQLSFLGDLNRLGAKMLNTKEWLKNFDPSGPTKERKIEVVVSQMNLILGQVQDILEKQQDWFWADNAIHSVQSIRILATIRNLGSFADEIRESLGLGEGSLEDQKYGKFVDVFVKPDRTIKTKMHRDASGKLVHDTVYARPAFYPELVYNEKTGVFDENESKMGSVDSDAKEIHTESVRHAPLLGDDVLVARAKNDPEFKKRSEKALVKTVEWLVEAKDRLRPIAKNDGYIDRNVDLPVYWENVSAIAAFIRTVQAGLEPNLVDRSIIDGWTEKTAGDPLYTTSPNPAFLSPEFLAKHFGSSVADKYRENFRLHGKYMGSNPYRED